MEDKENPVVEGQETEAQATESPKTTESPDVDTQSTDSPASDSADKELAEWASNKGYSEEDLANEKTAKALKMAMNAERMPRTQTAEKSAEDEGDTDIDALLNEILGDESSPQDNKAAANYLGGIDVNNLTPEQKADLDRLNSIIEGAVNAKLGPLQKQFRQQQYKSELESLRKEFGDDVIKKSPDILKRVKEGSKLRDAVVSVLMEDKLKEARSSGFKEGKQALEKAIREKTEDVKKTEVQPKVSPETLRDLPLAEHEQLLRDLANKS